MTQKFWRPWIDPRCCGEGAQSERYALRDPGRLNYLAIAAESQLIEVVADPGHAWVFHTHERAVCAAREIAKVLGQPLDVVKIA